MSACGGLDPDVVHGFDQTHANIAEVLGELVAANRERVARDGSENPIAMGVLSTWLEAKVDPVDLADLLALAIKRLAAFTDETQNLIVFVDDDPPRMVPNRALVGPDEVPAQARRIHPPHPPENRVAQHRMPRLRHRAWCPRPPPLRDTGRNPGACPVSTEARDIIAQANRDHRAVSLDDSPEGHIIECRCGWYYTVDHHAIHVATAAEVRLKGAGYAVVKLSEPQAPSWPDGQLASFGDFEDTDHDVAILVNAYPGHVSVGFNNFDPDTARQIAAALLAAAAEAEK